MRPVDELARGLRSLARRVLNDVCRRGRRTPDDGGCAEECDSRRLTQVAPGTVGTVSCLEEPGSRASRKLVSIGLLPGVPLEVLQDRPVYVIRVRETQYALDPELASRVRLVPEEGSRP